MAPFAWNPFSAIVLSLTTKEKNSKRDREKSIALAVDRAKIGRVMRRSSTILTHIRKKTGPTKSERVSRGIV